MDNPNDIKATLAQTLRAWMDASIDLNTQAKLAARAGVAQATIGRMLIASHAASVDNVESVARAFGRTAAELLGGVSSDIQYDREAFARLPESERGKVEAFIKFMLQQNEQATPSLTFTRETNVMQARPQRPVTSKTYSTDDVQYKHGKRARVKAEQGNG